MAVNRTRSPQPPRHIRGRQARQAATVSQPTPTPAPVGDRGRTPPNMGNAAPQAAPTVAPNTGRSGLPPAVNGNSAPKPTPAAPASRAAPAKPLAAPPFLTANGPRKSTDSPFLPMKPKGLV